MARELEKGYYSSPRWTWEILDCAMPMTFDTYSNCAFQCMYCFSFFQRAIGSGADDYLNHKVSSVDVAKVKRMFLDPDKYGGQFKWYIKQRMVLQWGGLSDGFDYYERMFRKSLDLLRFFIEIDYPISISTKGVWFLDEPDYRAVLKDAKNVHFKYSIITTDAEDAKIVEAGVVSPQERFLALKKLHDLGIGYTTLRLRPYVIGITNRTIEDLFRQAKAANCDSATTEFLCVESRSSTTAKERWDRMSKVCGFDVFKFYRDNSAKGGLMRLNYDLKRPYMERMKALAAEYGIPLFVSDAHHKEVSAGTGCCGLPDEGPLSKINRGQFAEAIQIAKREGKVSWKDIQTHAQVLKQIPFGKAEGYNQGDSLTRAKRTYQTMYDFMQSAWNNPKSQMSPALYFGGALVPAPDLDADGNVVYLYNQPFIENAERVSSAQQLVQAIAKNRDKFTEDGAAFGHVALPIYLLVSKKVNKVSELLYDSRLSYIVVTTEKLSGYCEEEFQDVTILVAEGDETLEACAQKDAESNYYYGLWMLNSECTLRVEVAEGLSVTARAILSRLERDEAEAELPSGCKRVQLQQEATTC